MVEEDRFVNLYHLDQRTRTTQGRFAIYTSATTTYLDRANVLADSLRQRHPEADLFIVFPDEAPIGLDLKQPLAAFDAVIRLQDLGLHEDWPWLFSHDVVELCTAVKPYAMEFIAARGYEKIIYLDPDICTFASLEVILNALDEASILLTPHQLRPDHARQAIIDNELCSQQYGVYNLGFVAIRNDASGLAFARWWRERCRDYCLDEPTKGLFTDQKMCDLVPALFDNVKILRHAGLNVASWNLSQRRIEAKSNGELLINGVDPLVFFHFTKINHVGEVMIRRYCQGSTLPLELMRWYRRQLQQFEVEGIPDRYWKYGRFADGALITGEQRRRYRNAPRADALCANPFALLSIDFNKQFPPLWPRLDDGGDLHD